MARRENPTGNLRLVWLLEFLPGWSRPPEKWPDYHFLEDFRIASITFVVYLFTKVRKTAGRVGFSVRQKRTALKYWNLS